MIAFAMALQAAATTPVAIPGQWTLTERTNPAGVRSVSATVVASDGLSRFLVKCDIGKEPIVSIQFNQPNPLGASPDKPVAVRFDRGLAVIDDWSFPGSGSYIADAAEVTKLTMLLVKSKEVAVETTNAANFAVEADFAAPPNDVMIRRIFGACGYAFGVVPPPPPAKAP